MFVARSSSVAKFERCQRRWRYSEDTPEPTTAALEIGTAVHKCLEEWLRNGEPFPLSKAGFIAKKGLQFLPPPSKDLRIEVTDTVDVAPGVQFRRTIDLFDPVEPRLWDHKTFSDPRWIPTPETLLSGVQSTSYAMWALDHLGTDTIAATWLYYPKANGNAVPVELVFERHRVAKRWAQTLSNAKKMAVLLEKSPEACDTNYEACNDYGKECPFYKQCRGKVDIVGLGSRYLLPLTVTPVTGQIYKQCRGKVDTVGLDLMSKMKKNLPITDVPASPPSLLERQLQASILPPDAPPDTFEAMPVEEPKKTRAKRTPAAGRVVMTYDPRDAQAILESITAAPVPAPSFGPTSPDGVTWTSRVTAAPVPAPGFELWIGAMRDGHPHVKIEELAGPVADKVAADNGVSHFALIDYAKGTPMLAVAFAEHLDANPPVLPIFVDRVPSALGKAVLEVLVRKAGSILRGV